MVKKYRWLLLCGVVYAVGFSMALCLAGPGVLDLELTKGVAAGIPIAIVVDPGTEQVEFQSQLLKIVRADLQNSGRFALRVIEASGGARQETMAQLKAQGANYAIWLGVEGLPTGQYKVSLHMADVYADPATDASINYTLSQGFEVNDQEIRPCAHRMSDLVYQKLIGVVGVFSTRLAYVFKHVNDSGQMRYALQVSDMDGYNPKTLLESREPILSPAWSPDGRSLAYVSFESQRARIYVQDIHLGTRTLISRYPGINGAPAWSPDGRHMVLVLTRSGAPKLYDYSLESKKIIQLTHGMSLDTEPCFSPDGQSVYFTSNRGGSAQIYRLSLVDQKITRMTYQGGYNVSPDVTPDGRFLVMLHKDTAGYVLIKQDLENDEVTVLADSGYDESPSVAPNGQMLVYATRYGGRGVLGMVGVDGQVNIRLPSQVGDSQEPVWSPLSKNNEG